MVPKPQLQNDSVVLVRDKLLKRCQWPLGRISEVVPSQDGTVRKAFVDIAKTTGASTTKRRYLRVIQDLVLVSSPPSGVLTDEPSEDPSLQEAGNE